MMVLADIVVLAAVALGAYLAGWRAGNATYKARWRQANRLLQAKFDEPEEDADGLGGLRVATRRVTMKYTGGELEGREVQGIKFVVLDSGGEELAVVDQTPGRVGLPFAEDTFEADYEKYREKALTVARRLARDRE